MRELNSREVCEVNAGSAQQTMDAGCFAATVFLGISPFFGPSTIVSAVFGVFTACHDVDFMS